MNKSLLLFLSFLFAIKVTNAQNNWPPVFEIKTDTTVLDTLPVEYWQILEDKDGELNLDQVRQSPFADRFHYNASGKIDREITTYWFRFILKNVTDHEVNIGFYDRYQGSSDWYIIATDGKITRKKTGAATPWSKKDDLKLINFFSVAVRPQETLTFYGRAHYHYFFFSTWKSPQSFLIEYGFAEEVVKRNYISDETHYFWGLHNSFLFGAMLLAAIFSFLFFLIIRERVYIYFALYVFFLGFGRFNIDSEFFHVFLREYPLMYAYLNAFIWVFPDLFLALFLRYLLQIKKYFPLWDKFIISFILFFLAAYTIRLLVDFYTAGTEQFGLGGWILMSPVIVLHLGLLFTFFLFLTQNRVLEKWVLIAILPSFTIWAVLVDIYHLYYGLLQDWYHLKPSGFLVWLYQNWELIETICLCWQVFWFSWFLLHRFVELRKQVVQKELEKEIERSQLIAQQKIDLEKQVTERTSELNQSLQNLKSTQAQLVQQEKMASLGELTAGIAHEIQNPLNFVNNFSEVNKELLTELKDGIEKGNLEEIKAIASNIIDNEEKIGHHGKRADAIVKGMLQHSQISSGQKEPTDINALCDEYLRLAYHGMRAKDKSINVALETSFDKSIGKINVVPQEIGRVLLNLYNNAFYAVTEKKKHEADAYEPMISVSTQALNSNIKITVKDNGNGIPEKIRDKIFQPFFTTKPAGQGTGLGLSLAYDIVKAHGGEFKVETKEGEGSEFVVQLPVV